MLSSRAGSRPQILVLARPFLGDTVLAGPLLRNMRPWMPDAEITVAAYVGSTDGWSLFPEVDRVVAIHKTRAPGESRTAFFRHWVNLLREVRAARFDLVYDLMQTDKSALISIASAAERRVSYVNGKRRLRHSLYSDVVLWTDEEMRTTHHVDLYMKALATLGATIRTRSVQVTLHPKELEAARVRLQSAIPARVGPLIAVHPGASSPNRCWPPEHFAAICDFAQEHLGTHVLLMGGPSEAGALDVVKSSMRTRPAEITERLSTREFAAVLAQAELFLGNNSGPMHLAAAVGTPVVAVFDAAVPSQWQPLGENHSVLVPENPCPCVCPARCEPPYQYKTFCVRTIERERVAAAVAKHLEAHPLSRAGTRPVS